MITHAGSIRMSGEAHAADQSGESPTSSGTAGADRRNECPASAKEAAGEAVSLSLAGAPVHPELEAAEGGCFSGTRCQFTVGRPGE